MERGGKIRSSADECVCIQRCRSGRGLASGLIPRAFELGSIHGVHGAFGLEVRGRMQHSWRKEQQIFDRGWLWAVALTYTSDRVSTARR